MLICFYIFILFFAFIELIRESLVNSLYIKKKLIYELPKSNILDRKRPFSIVFYRVTINEIFDFQTALWQILIIYDTSRNERNNTIDTRRMKYGVLYNHNLLINGNIEPIYGHHFLIFEFFIESFKK